MQEVREGSHNAYQILVARHTRPISHYAFRMLGNRKDTEDITQETFLRLWTQADRFNPGKSQLTTWLHRIAHNLCIDYLRKHNNTELTEQLDEIEVSPNSDSAIENCARVKRLYVALMALPENQRSALTLCHFQNFSNQEAAAIMEISVKALESNLIRARRTLRDTVGTSNDDQREAEK